MTATPALTADLKAQLLTLEEDLRKRLAADAERTEQWRSEHRSALTAGRTAMAWETFRDDRLTQVAVAWVLTTVFIRFCEDNSLVAPVWIAGPPHRRQEAVDAQLDYFRTTPEHTDREWLLQAVEHLRSLPATEGLVDGHSPLWQLFPSGNAVTALLDFWRRRDDGGRLIHDLTDPSLSTRFLGDLYQDLSEYARDTYALLQTPVFVEEFILDQTLEPALGERPLDGFTLIDPTCGSGHFLLGAFGRLLERWRATGIDDATAARNALTAIHGVDINPFAVAIARFRLTVAALHALGLTSLADAPELPLNLAVGDSLLHGGHPELDLGIEADAELSGFTYSTEDLEKLRGILTPGTYDVVVGNPPYITVRDKTLNQEYRKRYSSCKGTYALTVPFMERFFELARRGSDEQPAGWTGQITSNSFMKREFGSRIIEEFLVKQDLRLVADTSGAYIPGHGTPTVIIVGRNQHPTGDTVRAVLGIRGEPGRPADPADGLVWRSLADHVNEPGYEDEWVTIADLDRAALATHPWSLSGGGATEVVEIISRAENSPLRNSIREIGRTTHTGNDEAFFLPAASATTLDVRNIVVPVVLGEEVRDYALSPANVTIFPYGATGEPTELSEAGHRHLWRVRRHLETQLDFQQTKAERGLRWFDHSMFFAHRYRTPLSIPFAFVATHNHFVLDRGGKVFKQSAPVIKLPEGASEEEHLHLLGVLNSSTALFWLKQNSHDKGNGGYGGGIASTEWERFYEFTGTTLQNFPLPAVLPLERGRTLNRLAEQATAQTPDALAAEGTPTAAVLSAARSAHAHLRGRMLAEQEELDWETYRLYSLLDDDLTYSGDDLPTLKLGERAFEIVLARKVADGQESTAWFDRHGSTPVTEIPDHWPDDYRELVQRRIDLITSDRFIGLLERPEHKRRWAATPWEKQQEAALRGWLLDRLEHRNFWFDRQGRPAPRSVGQLADLVARDEELVEVITLWEGRRDVPLTDSLSRLMVDEAVPYLASLRLKESGMRKRAAWEEAWALQRREDAGEQVGPIPVPPRYTSADFRRPAWWKARGKLDVPKERFILYPDAGRSTDPTALLGWAGWDHAQQALALAIIIGEREAEGWEDEPLVPLVAGLAELQPWVEQWHSEVDPAIGMSMAAFCAEQLRDRAHQVGKTREELAAWRPVARTRRRSTRARR